MLLQKIRADAPGAWLPVKPGPPTLRQQIELSRLESGSDRYPRETSLQPETFYWMENQFSAVERPIQVIGKADNPASSTDENPGRNPHSTFLIDAKYVGLRSLADPQGFFVQSKTVCEIASKLKIKSLPRACCAISGCIAEVACVRLESVQRVTLMRDRQRQLVLQKIVPVFLQTEAVRMARKGLFHFAASIVFLFFN